MKKSIRLNRLLVVLASFTIALLLVSAKKGSKYTVIDKGIKFEKKGWEYALAEAKTKNKLVFLDAFTSWCGPCKLLKNTTFTDKAAGDFFNKNFINVTVDMEKGIGISLAKKYNVDAYPTLIIADSEGNVVTYTKGYISPEQLIEFGKYALSASKTR